MKYMIYKDIVNLLSAWDRINRIAIILYTVPITRGCVFVCACVCGILYRLIMGQAEFKM